MEEPRRLGREEFAQIYFTVTSRMPYQYKLDAICPRRPKVGLCESTFPLAISSRINSELSSGADVIDEVAVALHDWAIRQRAE